MYAFLSLNAWLHCGAVYSDMSAGSSFAGGDLYNKIQKQHGTCCPTSSPLV
jgi:hypothetical protein